MSFMLLGILNSQAAGGGGGGFDLLETTTLTSSASSVTFSGIDQSYKHLQVRMTLRSTRAFATDTWGVRFNGVSTASYAYHRLRGNGSTVASIANTSMTIMDTGTFPDSTQAANIFGVSVIDVLDFSSISKNTTIKTLTGMTGSQNYVNLNSGFYNSTDAITSISLESPQGFSAVAGTRVSIYGVK